MQRSADVVIVGSGVCGALVAARLAARGIKVRILEAGSRVSRPAALAQYHAALIKLHTGDIDGATALGDTILANNPGHLFGYIVLGTVARFRKDDAGLSKAYSGFLTHYQAEMKAGRAEYTDHARSITDFKKAAEAARSPA